MFRPSKINYCGTFLKIALMVKSKQFLSTILKADAYRSLVLYCSLLMFLSIHKNIWNVGHCIAVIASQR